MQQARKKLAVCLIAVVLLAVAAGLFYWYAGGVGLTDDAVLVNWDERRVFQWLG